MKYSRGEAIPDPTDPFPDIILSPALGEETGPVSCQQPGQAQPAPGRQINALREYCQGNEQKRTERQTPHSVEQQARVGRDPPPVEGFIQAPPHPPVEGTTWCHRFKCVDLSLKSWFLKQMSFLWPTRDSFPCFH